MQLVEITTCKYKCASKYKCADDRDGRERKDEYIYRERKCEMHIKIEINR